MSAIRPTSTDLRQLDMSRYYRNSRNAQTLPRSLQNLKDRQRTRHFSSKGDDDWIPPDHFADKISSLNQYNTRTGITSSSVTNADEIEVIDVEATMRNPSNIMYLDELNDVGYVPEEDFNIESSDSDWDELLMEMKGAGEIENLKQIVEQFGLQDKLAKVEAKEAARGDDFDSLEGLPEHELIDELIESSSSLSQLEMEILTEEAKHGLDLENDNAVNENAAYIEFRMMVLDDYNKQKREKEDAKANTTSASDYSFYPQDWKDYDSKAAFSRDFLEGEDSWIPPVKGFVPAKAMIEPDETSADKETTPTTENVDAEQSDFDNTVDWLQARRSRLDGDKKMPSQMLTPDEAETFRHENSHIPIKLYTLFTPTEISTSLSAQGGTDIHIIDTSDYDALYGISLGCDHLMIVTGRNSSHIRVLAESVVRNLKDRKLHERGIVGAMQGPEGGKDIFANKPSRNRASRNGQTNLSSKVDDDWMVVDCGNIHVHILESVTRKCLNIEGLWDLNDPNSEGSKLRRINYENDDEGKFSSSATIMFVICQVLIFSYALLYFIQSILSLPRTLCRMNMLLNCYFITMTTLLQTVAGFIGSQQNHLPGRVIVVHGEVEANQNGVVVDVGKNASTIYNSTSTTLLSIGEFKPSTSPLNLVTHILALLVTFLFMALLLSAHFSMLSSVNL